MMTEEGSKKFKVGFRHTLPGQTKMVEYEITVIAGDRASALVIAEGQRTVALEKYRVVVEEVTE